MQCDSVELLVHALAKLVLAISVLVQLESVLAMQVLAQLQLVQLAKLVHEQPDIWRTLELLVADGNVKLKLSLGGRVHVLNNRAELHASKLFSHLSYHFRKLFQELFPCLQWRAHNLLLATAQEGCTNFFDSLRCCQLVN